MFTNGFVFDELPLDVVKAAIETASSAGAAILFDPGKCESEYVQLVVDASAEFAANMMSSRQAVYGSCGRPAVYLLFI